MITVHSTINLTNQAVPPIIPVVQGDTGRAIAFTLADFTIPAGATATYYVQKPSGEAVYNSAEISGNTVTVELTAQSIIEVGENKLQVRIILDEAVVTSFDVILMVRPFRGIGAVESETEMNIFDKAVEQATEEFQTNAEQIVEEVIESIPADYTELTEEVDELNERLDNLEPGLSDNAKVALLACFQHVVWTDDDDDYYATLAEALYFGAEVTSISAVYDASGHSVHQYDTLESLEPYIVVTANYSNGTSSVVSNYTMSGNLNSEISVITISFSGKTTQISVNVVIDSTLLYYAPSGYVLDGTNDTIIDTGVELSETNQTITIVFDVTDDEVLTSARTAQLLYSYETLSSGVAGYNMALIGQASDDSFNKIYSAAVSGATSLKSPAQTNAAHRVKGALQYVSTSGEFNFTLYVDGTTIYENYASSCNFRTGGTNAYIGGRGTGGFLWKGTIYLFNIYNRELTLSEIKELLGVA